MSRIFTLLLCFLTASLSAMPQDSIGTKMVNGKTFVMHKVSKGEGVFGIARKYGVTAADIYKNNPGSEQSIKIDQVLLIPRNWNSYAGSGKGNSSEATSSEKVYHTVAKGQTLSSIAKQYNTSVDQIKSLNSLSSDNIRLGQKLLVKSKNTYESNYPVPVQIPVQAPASSGAVVSREEPAVEKPVEQTNVVVNTTSPVAEPSNENPGSVNTTYSTDDGDEIAENGTAVVSSEGELSQERSFILHPSARIGTIVMITNAGNNNTVFARVVGNCKPESGVLLKMSKTVAAKLGVSGNTEVKVSYAK